MKEKDVYKTSSDFNAAKLVLISALHCFAVYLTTIEKSTLAA